MVTAQEASSTSQPILPGKTQKKKGPEGFDRLWNLLIVFFTVVSAIIFNKVYIYQNHPFFAAQRQGSLQKIFYYAIPLTVFFIFADRLIHKTFDQPVMKHFIAQEKFPDLAVRTERGYLVVKWSYSFVYYVVSSIWAYYILVNTNILPPWLGGSGSPANLFLNRLKINGPIFSMDCFYMMSLGKHLGRLITHLLIKHEGKFYELAFHHGVSVLLIMISYLMNQWVLGIFVLFVHDASDGLFLFGRIYKDYRNMNKRVLAFIGASALLQWIFLRLIVFSLCCWIPAVDAIYQWRQEPPTHESQIQEIAFLPFLILTTMLIALQIIQIFWTYYLGKASFKAVFGVKNQKQSD